MRSKYKGRCSSCGESFNEGAEIKFVPGKGVVGCPSCQPHLSDEAQAVPAKSSEIRVKVKRIRFSKPDGSWVILDAQLDGTDFADIPIEVTTSFPIVGPLGEVRQGDVISVIGTWINDATYGIQFKSSGQASLAVAESEAGLKAFLCRSLPNVGPTRAEAMIRQLGGREAVLQIIEHNPMALLAIKGITEERALEIQQAFLDAGGFREVTMFAAEIGLSESLLSKSVTEWGTDAKNVITADPYRIMDLERVGFKAADEVAKKLGIGGEDPRRCAAVTHHLLECSSDLGHTWTTLEALVADVASELKETGLTKAHLEKGVEILSRERTVKRKNGVRTLPPFVTVIGERIYIATLEMAERTIASKLLTMLNVEGSDRVENATDATDDDGGGKSETDTKAEDDTKDEDPMIVVINPVDDVDSLIQSI